MVHDQHGDISRLAYFQGQQVQSEYSTRGAVRKMSYTARCLRWTQSCSKSFVKEVVGLLEMSDVILVRGTKRWTLDIIYCPPFWLWTSWVAVNLLRQYIVAIKDANLWFMRMQSMQYAFFFGSSWLSLLSFSHLRFSGCEIGASQFLAQRLHRLGRVLCRSDAPGWGTEESSGDDWKCLM